MARSITSITFRIINYIAQIQNIGIDWVETTQRSHMGLKKDWDWVRELRNIFQFLCRFPYLLTVENDVTPGGWYELLLSTLSTIDWHYFSSEFDSRPDPQCVKGWQKMSEKRSSLEDSPLTCHFCPQSIPLRFFHFSSTTGKQPLPSEKSITPLPEEIERLYCIGALLLHVARIKTFQTRMKK